jgi:hypothetical protein
MNRLTSVALAAVLAGSTVPLLAGAAAAQARPHDVIYTTQYRAVHKVNNGDKSGDWTHCLYVTKAKYTQYPSCSQGVTVTEAISGGYGFSSDIISSSVGFSVSYSQTISTSDSVQVKPGGHGWFDMGFRYDQYTVGMEVRTCIVETGSCTRWSGPTRTVVQRHLGQTYFYFGTGAS